MINRFIENNRQLIPIRDSANGLFTKGKDGIIDILTARDKKADFIIYEDKILVFVKSALGYPAIYNLKEAHFEAPAQAVLMDLDGTSVHSESFWVWIIEQTTARLIKNPKFSLEPADEPFVSGHSVSEHLQYCINKYCPDKTVEEARKHYFVITRFEMNEIMQGRGRANAFVPSPGLKEFLLALKANQIKIGLVTSGLYEKAIPEIISAFRVMNLGDPLAFYDAIITAGFPLGKGKCGTLGELSPKPHPWLYAESARVGLGIEPEMRKRVIGFEDSSAGVLSLRLAGFAVIGIKDGNIAKSGMESFLYRQCENLMEALPVVLGD
jgi:beta-phosphoglucomutase-like phosphatase (HAD superfamily)